MAKPSDVKKVTLTRSEWNLLDAGIDPDKRANLQRIIDKLMAQVGH